MLLDRPRLKRLMELSALEPVLKGPERMLRESDVALLVKAAYDDASEAARADFMARVQKQPTSAWPWSAVQAMPMTARGGGGGAVIIGVPQPLTPTTPATLVLLRGQVDTADADPGNRIPDRGAADSVEWEPLHRALDTWDTQTIARWIGPSAWITPTGAAAGQVPKDTGKGDTSGPPAGGVSPSAPPNGGTTPGPQPQPTQPAAFTWRHPAVIAAGATVASTIGVVLFSRRHRAPQVEPAREGEP